MVLLFQCHRQQQDMTKRLLLLNELLQLTVLNTDSFTMTKFPRELVWSDCISISVTQMEIRLYFSFFLVSGGIFLFKWFVCFCVFHADSALILGRLRILSVKPKHMYIYIMLKVASVLTYYTVFNPL